MTKHFFIAALILVFAFSSCKSKKQNVTPTALQAAIVDVIIAQTQSISNTIEANGTVVANEYVELHPEVSGRLIYLNVPEGKHIEQGTLIARVFDADIEAQLAKSKVQLNLAEITEQRDKKLLAVNGINQSDYDVAANQVQSIQTDISYYQSLIQKTYIKAPFSGVVGLRQVSPGAYVTPSNVIATVQQLNKVKIDFTVPQQYINIIQKGKTVDIEASDGNQSGRKKAVIVAVEPEITATSRNLKVRALLQDGTANLGAFVKVYISAGAESKAIMIPTNCIIPDDKNKQVVVVKNGKAAFTNIETGFRDISTVEVTNGLNVGDTVAVTGLLFARPKSTLKIRSIKTLDQLTK